MGKWLEIGWQRQIPAPHRCLTFVTETLKTYQVRPCLIFILERAYAAVGWNRITSLGRGFSPIFAQNFMSEYRFFPPSEPIYIFSQLLGFPFFFKGYYNLLFIYLFILYLFLAVLGLRFCARAFSSCGKRGPLFIVVRGPLHRLQTRRLSSCGSRA